MSVAVAQFAAQVAAQAGKSASSLFGGIPAAAMSQSPQLLTAHQSNGTDTGVNTRTAHVLTAPTAVMRLLYGNRGDPAGFVSGPATPIIIRAAVESARPVFFNGRRDGQLDPFGLALTDPISLGGVAAVGTTAFVRTSLSTPGGSTATGPFAVNHMTASALGEGSVYTAMGVAPADLTTSGSISASATYGFGPLAVITMPGVGAAPSIAGHGDSIMAGAGDNAGPAGDLSIMGFLARAVNKQYGFINLGFNGDSFGSVLTPQPQDPRLAITACYGNVMLNHGTNSLMIGADSTAATKAAAVSAWTVMASLGPRVFQGTCPPRTSSSDGYVTASGQAPVTTNPNAGETGRQAFNAWLRAGAPIDPITKLPVAIGTSGALLCQAHSGGSLLHPLFDVWDVAATVESSTAGVLGAGGAVWRPGYVETDGTHPNNAIGHAAFATACNMAQLAA